MRSTAAWLVCSGVGLLLAVPAQAGFFSLVPGTVRLEVEVDQSTGPSDTLFNQLTPTTLPFATTDSIGDPINAYSETTYNYSESGNQVDLNATMTQSVAENAIRATAFASLRFEITQDATYAFTTQLTGAGDDPDDEYRIFTTFTQIGSGGPQIYNELDLVAATSAFLQGGDGIHTQLIGSSSGLLSAGIYQLSYTMDTTNRDIFINGAQASTGIYNLQLVAVPEPGTALLLSFGALGLLIRRNRSLY